MHRALAGVALLAGAWLAAPAFASEKPQIVTVQVVDPEGEPIPTAWVRVPGTEGRRNVEPKTGVWEASMLYTYGGDELVFTKGMKLDITISAPGYVPVNVKYEVHARKNMFTVALQPAEEREILPETAESEDDLLIRWFKRTHANTDD